MPMKIRKFYPAQVLRKLDGQAVGMLDAAHRAALKIGMLRTRRAGVIISIVEGAIAVHGATQVGQMILGDLKEVAKRFSAKAPDLAESLPKLVQAGRDLGIVVTPSQFSQ